MIQFSPTKYHASTMPTIDPAEFARISQPLLGLTIMRTSNSFGSAIFLDLDTADDGGAVSFYWDWRLEDDTEILCGSSNSRPDISSALQTLIGLKIAGLVVEKPLPDITIILSNGWRLRSMSLISGNPEWHITLPDQSILGGRLGKLIHTLNQIPDDYHPDPLADRFRDISIAAEKRWFDRSAIAPGNKCQDCLFFVRLNGPAAFLWYGACACADSPFDRKVVHQASHCDQFFPANPVPP